MLLWLQEGRIVGLAKKDRARCFVPLFHESVTYLSFKFRISRSIHSLAFVSGKTSIFLGKTSETTFWVQEGKIIELVKKKRL
jgi:hypothetical protein